MNQLTLRNTLATLLTAVALLSVSACAVTRGQESVGSYIDDSAITTAVKARFADNREVDASSISVETMKGTVLLSGFAKSQREKDTAQGLTWKISGVKAVKNEITVRP